MGSGCLGATNGSFWSGRIFWLLWKQEICTHYAVHTPYGSLMPPSCTTYMIYVMTPYIYLLKLFPLLSVFGQLPGVLPEVFNMFLLDLHCTQLVVDSVAYGNEE